MVPVLLLVAPLSPVRAFDDYLKKPDSTYAWKAGEMTGGSRPIEMTSQTWQGIAWKHSILYRQPDQAVAKGTAILYITGDGPRPGDLIDLAVITASARVPVAMLFDIPNQPLWDMKEDDLIAHTFQKYLESGDPTWPLLLPMTKSALRAMDAIQAYTNSSDNPITRFVVTGASKRGWTTWLVGASGDKRVAAIAPMVYDNLNLAAQMPHQLKVWGKYSEQIEDYTRRGLQAQLSTPRGRNLGAMVDPFTYRDRIKAPTLVVKGSNDPYWTEDALSLYWSKLKQPRFLLTVPNAGHTLGNHVQAVETVGAFARAVASDLAFPEIEAEVRKEGDTISAAYTGSSFISIGKHHSRVGCDNKGVRLWIAQSETTDFRESQWKPYEQEPYVASRELRTVKAKVGERGHFAAYLEARFLDASGKQFSVCSPTQVF